MFVAEILLDRTLLTDYFVLILFVNVILNS